MSIQDLINRIDTARSNFQEAKNQIAECSCSTTGDAECECSVEITPEPDSSLPKNTGKASEGECTDSEAVDNADKSQQKGDLKDIALGYVAYGIPGAIVGGQDPELLDEMIDKGIEGGTKALVTSAASVGIAAAVAPPTAPVTLTGGTVVIAGATVTGAIVEGYTPLIQELTGQNEDSEQNED